MTASYGLILFLMLCCCSNIVFAEDHEDLEVTSPISEIPNDGQENMNPDDENGKEVSYPGKNDGQENMNPDDENGKALSYPGCGFRTPKIPENSTQSWGSRSGGFESTVGGHKEEGLDEEDSWPWMVALYDTGADDWNMEKHLICGASLISRKYALVAAHCFGGRGDILETDPSKWSVAVGAHSSSDGTKYPVSRILPHPDYSTNDGPNFVLNDIALIEFETPVELSKIVNPVCLPSTGLTDRIEADRSEVVATKWRIQEEGGDNNLVFQEIEVFPVPLEECKAFVKNVIKGQICATDTVHGKDICMGDSGGPMVYELEDHSYVQVGLASYDVRCKTPGSPTVNTRVSEYLKWIYDNSDLGKSETLYL